MLKKISVAAIAALTIATASTAMAEEYLETTGARNAPAYSAPAYQQGVRAHSNTRLEQRGFLSSSSDQSAIENSARDKVTSGQGG
ncbi:hypothetical protein GJW-30_1_02273 [Variibacter gotjawalensis]|uniref:DUF4148 domain-containing protein n=1 Tax=Variibacter gotjawalensis TaxID=1333996 RepID=A0A0S3PV30_9BRAD|nr:hypothetical protein [Variibacter gotjawalensis]NIK50066.1 hypothetical protein [Variibacter gotjawalensis]RZS46065.1 hypothetical protein EV661_4391 [Variibacter gotjawalensis]BAT59740.1 hypothetical protein GJW-30_1_02273 [Variibacter gotjawalensis]